MTVRELIQILVKQPGDRRVFVANDAEGNGYKEVRVSSDDFGVGDDGYYAEDASPALVLWP